MVHLYRADLFVFMLRATMYLLTLFKFWIAFIFNNTESRVCAWWDLLSLFSSVYKVKVSGLQAE